MEWTWWKDWWRLRKWRHRNNSASSASATDDEDIEDYNACCYCDECFGELSDGCVSEDGCLQGDLEGEGKQVLVGICAMAKKSQSKPMKEILTRLEEFEYIKIIVFAEDVILKEPVENWPIVDCLISFHSKGFPLEKAISYANLRNPFIINNLPMQYDIQDRRRVYAILESEGIEIPRYAVLDRDSPDPKHHELVESEDHVEVNGVTFNKPFVEKPVSAEDHNIYIYYPTSAGGGSQRLFRKIGSRSSVYSLESRVRKTGSYIYEDFMPTDGTDVKVYTVGPDYAHAEARKSPALDGKVERDSEGKEIRYPVILSNVEKLISRKVCLAFKQTVCGFDLLRANGKSFVCDVNGFSFVKNSNKYYDDCAKILGNMILRELAPTLHIPWSVPFQLDDPPIVPTTFGKMMELRCVVAVIRHGDRTPKQKMKVEVRHPKFFEIFAKYDGYKHGHVKLKRPKQLQEILDTARSLLAEIQHRAASSELEEKQGKLEQLKNVLEMYGHFSGINRKVQMKYQPRGRPRGSSSDDGNRLGEPSLVLILKWGGELTPAGRIQAEELGRIFRCMYPGGQGRHLSEDDTEMLPNHGEYAGAQGLGLLRLHSTFRHDLKIYASDEGRVQMTAAAFAKGLLALEGELTPILVQMVKSANTNGLLDNDCDSSKYQNLVKTRLHELLQQDKEFTREDREEINPSNALSINAALDFVKNPVKCCQHVQTLIQKLMDIVRIKKDDPKTKDAILYHGETWELMGRRWGKIEKDFCTKHKRFDISKIPDIYDCIKYDLQHNNHTLQFEQAEELYIYAKYLADIVIPQEYGLTVQEKLTIGQGICTPLLKKIRADLQRNIEESGEESVNRLNPRYSHGVSSPGRHVRTRLYFTSESHVHSLLTVLRYGGLLDVVKDEQWRRAMEYVSMVSELNYMSQIVVMLYEDPTKDPCSEERFHVELHFSPGVNCCVQKNLPPGPGFRPHSRNESSHNLVRKLKLGETSSNQDNASQCSTRIEEEDSELGVLEDDSANNEHHCNITPPLMEIDSVDANLDSPTTASRNIDMMDLDAALMDEPYDSGFLQSSAPIPISARTVAGHEAARLGSQLAASQRQRREREAGVICEPRARSYDHQRQEKPEKTADKLQYQSLDAVNKEAESPCSPSVPKYLGKPVFLAHSVSSPDLPIPILEVPNDPPSPIITLHSTPLASPNTNISSADDIYESIILNDTYDLTAQYLLPKKYGRSHSEMILPNIEVTGEFKPSPKSGDAEQLNPQKSPPESLIVFSKSQCLTEPQRLTDETLFEILNLTDLNVLEKRKITDKNVPEIANLTEHVVSEDPILIKQKIVSENPNLTDKTVSKIVHLTDLNVSETPNLTEKIVSEIANLTEHVVSEDPILIKQKIVSENPNLTDKTVSKIVHLTDLNVLETPNLTDKNTPEMANLTEQIVSKTPNLDLVSKNPNLTDETVSITVTPTDVCERPNPTIETFLETAPASLNEKSSVELEFLSTKSNPIIKRSRSPFLEVDNNRRTQSKRSRSLSPCPPNCLCYNCNVSKLIKQSLDLSPSEKSNFNTYFIRSLSHKFYNCSCYSLASSERIDNLNFQARICHQKLSDENRKSSSERIRDCRSLAVSNLRQKNGKEFKENSGECKEISGESRENIFEVHQSFERVTNGRPDTIINLLKFKIRKSMSCPILGVDSTNNTALNSCILYSSYSLDSLHPLCHNCSHFYHNNAHSSLDLEVDNKQFGFNNCTAHCNQNYYHNSHPNCQLYHNYHPNCQSYQNYHPNCHPNCHLYCQPYNRPYNCRHYHHNHQHCHCYGYLKNHCSKNPKMTPIPKLQHQRSFSSPDTRPSIIEPDPTCTARRHRHSISGQMSYFKLLGYNVSKKLTGSANSLFSTAVISGSSSAPNLKDMIPAHASAVAAIEGFGGVPPIRSLETLHNALSLRQLDGFLEIMTSAPLFRTPASSPPKIPSPGGTINQSMIPHLNIRDINREYHSSDSEAVRYRKIFKQINQYITPSPLQYKTETDNDTIDIRSQISPTSPNSAGWSSEPQSFLSSEPSSPAPTSAGESSMSISLISIDGNQSQNAGAKFTAPRLDLDFHDFCVTIDKDNRESRGSVSYTDYYSNEDGQIRRSGNGSTFPHIQAPVCTDDLTDNNECLDDEEDYTLTLRQSEEQKKQDLKSIFEQTENTNKSSNFKRIGRFRVESMDITDEDVRIKESCSLSSSYTSDKSKTNFLQRSESEVCDKNLSSSSSDYKKDTSFLKSLRNIGSASTSAKKKQFLRSQSVSNPKFESSKQDSRLSQQSSFSTLTSEDLQNWKSSSKKDSSSPISSSSVQKEQPVLTLASSLKDNSNITVGFTVQDDKKE
ncbi:uncharacterized protein LOC122499950 isoform X4 [Leptopilina heterotoma]|uniref:uncharacterized protein LOC122499950 isoform X4 n=1 Tax=Leptopilina heterotoma TaxID=63436 RepID=UPI001CA944D0|nr:uncharacterized protein LOC122499950 isoform X4 [Leptopilina heterotoma]